MSELTLNFNPIYKHQNCLSRLKIKSIQDSIAVCHKIDEPLVYNIKGNKVYPVMITNIDNLEIIN